MMKPKSSARFRFAGAALLLIMLSFLVPAVRDGDRRLYFLAVAVPSVLLLCITLLARMFSMDRMILSVTLYLCAVSILSLVTDPDAATIQALRCLAGITVLLLGTLTVRFLSPSLLGSCSFGFLGLLLLAGKLIAPSVTLDLIEPGIALMMISFVSFLVLFGAFPAMAAGLAGLALLLLHQTALVEAIIWSLSFLLLLWAVDGQPLVMLASLAGILLLFLGFRPLNPTDVMPAAVQEHSGLSVLISAGLIGSDTLSETLLSLNPDSLFPRLAGLMGLLFSVLTVMLFLPLLLRGSSVASCTRKRYHAALAMGTVLVIAFRALAALLSAFDILPFPAMAFPLLTVSLPSLCGQMYLIGVLCGISGKNEADLDEDAHLAMLAR